MALAFAAPPKRTYRRRRPERGVLHRVVCDNVETFFADRQAADPDGRGVPRFIEKRLRAFVKCGQLAHGFARFRCDGCGAERHVAFTCKARGLCPSCDGRRMTARAADFVDRVLPRVPYRQWVLSLPHWLRWRCAFDHELTLAIHRIVCRAIFGGLRRRAAARGHPGGRTSAVTVIQRFGGGLNLNVHFHILVPDGVWTEAPHGELCFHAVPAPTSDELEALCDVIARRVERHLVREGLWEPDDDGGRPADADDLSPIADLYRDAVVGKGTRRIGARMPLEPGTQLGRERRQHGGFDLHAGVTVDADDRPALERLSRYLLRPSVAGDRLELVPDGDVLVRLKAPWSDGTTHIRLTPMQLLERFAALMPRPQSNGVIYTGVFAANAKWRPRLVPRPEVVEAHCDHDQRRAGVGCLAPVPLESPGAPPAPDAPAVAPPPCSAPPPSTADDEPAALAAARLIVPAPRGSRLTPPRPNHTWADLMRRGLDIDSLDCPAACGGRLRLVALIEQPSVVRRILEHLGHDADPVGPKPARAPPPMDDFDWGA